MPPRGPGPQARCRRTLPHPTSVHEGCSEKMTPEQIGAWPGKLIDGCTHPALWHMLDVGAAAGLPDRPQATGRDPKSRPGGVFSCRPARSREVQCFFSRHVAWPALHGPRHWQHSYRLLCDHDGLLSDRLGATKGVRRILYAAVAGHHGGPPEHLDYRKSGDQAKQIGAEASRIAGEAIEAVASRFPGASLEGMTESEARRLSWALSGLTVQADWIGSNSEWFGPQGPETPIVIYWENALARRKPRSPRLVCILPARRPPEPKGFCP